MIFFNMQADEQGQFFSLNGDYGVRRIICTSTSEQSSRLELNGYVIACFNSSNSLELKFDSYHGFPKLSDFSVFQFGLGAVLVDTVPLSPINNDYFKEGEST